MGVHIVDYIAADYEPTVLYKSLFADGTLTASSSKAGSPVTCILGPQTYDYWEAATLPASITVTLAAPQAADTLAIFGHLLHSHGCKVTLQYQEITGADWETITEISPTDDSDLMFLFARREAIGWRLLITGGIPAPIAIAMLGTSLRAEGGVQTGYTPIHMASEVELSSSVTLEGQFVGTFAKRRGRKTAIRLSYQDRDWVESTAADFIDHFNCGGTFAFAPCPAGMPKDLGYCWRSGSTMKLATEVAGGDIFDVAFEVQAYAYP